MFPSELTFFWGGGGITALCQIILLNPGASGRLIDALRAYRDSRSRALREIP